MRERTRVSRSRLTEFLTLDGNRGRRFDAELYSAALDSHNRDDDSITDVYPLVGAT